MPTRHLTLRLDSETFDLLEAQSQQQHQPRSRVVKTLLEEGLRMESHPGIVFRAGPAGRRPGLAGGLDVWEVVSVFQGVQASGEEALRQTAELSNLTPAQVGVALRYYADYRAEIDDWIRRVEEDAARAEASWRRARDLLRR